MMGRSGDGIAAARSAPSCSSSRPPGSCQRGRWSPGVGPYSEVELQPIVVTPSQVRPRRPCPPRPLSIGPQRSSRDSSVRDRPVELHHQPSVGDPRVLPKPAVPSRLVAPGPPPPGLLPTIRDRRSGQSRRRLIARVGVTDSVGRGVPSACPRRGTRPRPCLAPLPLESGAPAARGSCCPQGQLSMVARPAVTQPAGSSLLLGEGRGRNHPGRILVCLFANSRSVPPLGICACIGPRVRIRRFLIGSRFEMTGPHRDGGGTTAGRCREGDRNA
jgi:hypothetical protein